MKLTPKGGYGDKGGEGYTYPKAPPPSTATCSDVPPIHRQDAQKLLGKQKLDAVSFAKVNQSPNHYTEASIPPARKAKLHYSTVNVTEIATICLPFWTVYFLF